jgi:HEAT repeat protein
MFLSQILEYLLDDELPFKPSVLYGLSELEPEELQQLSEAWADISPERRCKLARELVDIAEMNFEVNFDAIFRWSLHDDEDEVRVASIEGLWENEEPALMTEFLSLLQNDAALPVRAAAAQALGRFMLLGELGTLSKDLYRPVYDALCVIAQDQAEVTEVRRRALEAVSYVGSEKVIALLQEAYDHPDEDMRMSAIFGMGRSADSRWISTVMEGLYSVYPEIRYEAARACGELEARQATGKLAVLIQDPDREVQEAALWALGQVGGDEARRLLELCCQSEDEVLRQAAEAAMLEIELIHGGQVDFPFYELDPAGRG